MLATYPEEGDIVMDMDTFATHSDQAEDEIHQLLAAGRRRGLTEGVRALENALEARRELAAMVSRLGPTRAPSTPLEAPQTVPAPEAAPAPCRHVDEVKGPCTRTAHEPPPKARHRYGRPVTTRQAPALQEPTSPASLTSVSPTFSDAPKGARARDIDGHALIEGSNVVWAGGVVGSGSGIVRGWVGRVIDVDTETSKVLVYGKGPGKNARPVESMAYPSELRWVAAKDVPKAG